MLKGESIVTEMSGRRLSALERASFGGTLNNKAYRTAGLTPGFPDMTSGLYRFAPTVLRFVLNAIPADHRPITGSVCRPQEWRSEAGKPGGVPEFRHV